ncbi:TolC family outer membrane protein [Poseidonocella sp. HB161398]|uniref:TolC family outer membrane protein n=1 Tax=Poseidonocella sp. HB161398 TaxID=2320855 RepID=UPI001F0D0DB4|nr:TolC family outer membrane protein [Poseidonocella sp. HB161398]
MRKIKTTLLACAAAIAASAASAETLTDTLVSAYNNSNLLEQSRAVLRASDEDVAIAVSALRPILAYSASRSYFWDLDTDVLTTSSGARVRENSQSITNTLELTAQMSLFEFGRNRLSVEAAKEAVLAARQALVAQEQDVLFSAVQAYTQVRQAAAFVDLRRNNVRVLEEELRAANDRFDVGEVTRTDVAQAEAFLAAAQASLVAANGDLETAREAFNLAVGRYPGDLSPPPSFSGMPASLDTARDTAVRGHPAIRQQQFLVSAQEINVDIAQRNVMPSLSATGSVGYSDSSTSSNTNDMEPIATLGLEFGGPIYQGGQINALYRRAVATLEQNRSALLQTTLNVKERVGFAWANFQVAVASLEATERQIEASQVAFDGTREEATLGARTTLDVLNAEQDLLDARGSRIEALTVEQDAYYFLLSTMGQLTADNLGLDVVAYDENAYFDKVRTAPTVFTSEQGIKLDKVLKALGK